MRGAVPILLAGVAAAYLLVESGARAGGHAEACVAGTGNLELDVTFCTLAIQSERYREAGLATLLAHRGRARLELGDRNGAIADLDAALGLNPASALAYNERGRARHRAGDNVRAIADYSAAIALFPRYGAAFRNRGAARIFQGMFAAAEADFDAAIASVNHDPASRILRGIARYFRGDYAAAIPDLSAAISLAYPYPEAALWIYLAERRSGRDGGTGLVTNAEALAGDEWPRALIDAYLGETTPEAALAAARHPRAAVQRRRLTQANFYLGQRALLDGDAAAARERFRAAIAPGVLDAIEYAGAKLELDRLQR